MSNKTLAEAKVIGRQQLDQPVSTPQSDVMVPSSALAGNMDINPDGNLELGSLSALQSFRDLGLIDGDQAKNIMNSDPFLRKALIEWSHVFDTTQNTRMSFQTQRLYKMAFGSGMSGVLALARRKKLSSEILADLNLYADKDFVQRNPYNRNVQFGARQ